MFSTTFLKVLLMLTFGVSSAAETGKCPPTEKCECQVLGGEGKPHVFEVNCQQKKIKSLKSLSDLELLVGKPLVELDLKLNQLKDLPSEGFKGLKFKTLHKDMFPLLDLSSNPIKTINGDAFKGIKAATLELDLSNCTLEVFPKEAINKLPNLMSLQLKSNMFSSIPEQAFNRLKKLETIDLSGNRRLTLDENSFRGLETTVANVSLNDIRLTQFPADALKSLNKLQQLELDDNTITTLPAEIFKGFTTHTKKFRLSLRNNRMNFINSRAFADMGNLRLESLNLQGNRLTRLDFLIDPCSLSFTLGAFVKVRDNPINCDCDVYSAIVTEYTHVDGRCTEPRKYSQFWLNPSIDSRFQDQAAAECTDTNVTAVVTCERDGVDSSVGLFSSLTVTLFSSLLSFACVMAGL